MTSNIQPSSHEITLWHGVGLTITDRRVIVGPRSYLREEIRTAGITHVPANRKPAIIMAIVAAGVFVLMASAHFTLKDIAPLTLFIPAYLFWISAKARYTVHIHTAQGPVEVLSTDSQETARQAVDVLLGTGSVPAAPAPAPPRLLP